MTTASRNYLVVDLEATCDDNPATIPREESEIIEIGAVLVDGATLEPIGEYQTFVRPTRHPRLTAFCTELTTITQADVDGAPTLQQVAPRLAQFAPGARFCSWGAYDRNQLRRECERLAIDPPPLSLRDHLNLKEEFARVAGDRHKRGNRDVLDRLGIAATGIYHRGIDDARNIARTLPFVLGRLPDPAEGRVVSERVWIMVDLETSGPVIGKHSLTELGAVAGTRTRGVIDRFEALIAPIGPDVKTSRESYARAAATGRPPREAMAAFAAWCASYDRPTFIARPACFDWPWVVWYAWTFLGDNPFGFRALCASSWFEARGDKFAVELPHVAVEDARIQLEHFFAHG